MAIEKISQKDSIYKYRRYWYHLSSTLKKSKEHLIPWDENKATNRDWQEPSGKRICVAPSIEQCITAIPYHLSQVLTVYRTKEKIKPNPPVDVFDSNVTQEGWLLKPTTFLKVGVIDFQDVAKTTRKKMVITEAASGRSSSQSGKVLKWWKRKDIKRFLKKA